MKGFHHHSRTHFLMLILMAEHLGEIHAPLPEPFALAACRHFGKALCGEAEPVWAKALLKLEVRGENYFKSA